MKKFLKKLFIFSDTDFEYLDKKYAITFRPFVFEFIKLPSITIIKYEIFNISVY